MSLKEPLRPVPRVHPVVRPVGAADIEQVLEIERASFSDPWRERAFASLVDDPRVYFAAATAEGRAVLGYVVAWFVLDEGEIANLAVAPTARRHGLGATLLDAAIAAARDRQIASVFLEVRESNVAARELYASRGFTEIGRRRQYYRRPTEDALVLRLTLERPVRRGHGR
jgi:ribosomal-protein-alanine N-acetyltransferase